METAVEEQVKFQIPANGLNKIQTKKARNNTFKKRSRGFIKKAVELSSLCDQRIFVFIYDQEKNKAIQFTSDKEFSMKMVEQTAQ